MNVVSFLVFMLTLTVQFSEEIILYAKWILKALEVEFHAWVWVRGHSQHVNLLWWPFCMSAVTWTQTQPSNSTSHWGEILTPHQRTATEIPTRHIIWHILFQLWFWLRVTESKNVGYPVGSEWLCHFGWRSHTVANPSQTDYRIVKMPQLGNLPHSLALGCVGMPG